MTKTTVLSKNVKWQLSTFDYLIPYDICMFSTDIDECALGNHGCAETCENFGGGYFCSCQAGLRLAANGKDCEGIELSNFKRFD